MPRDARRSSLLVAFRIADGRFKVYDGTGAMLFGGRWNSPGRAVIYAGGSFAGAMLERLVHAGTGRIPKNQRSVVITVPRGVSVEEWDAARLPARWDAPSLVVSRRFGDEWLQAQRSAVLIVPSVVARHEKNVLINPAHPHFKRIIVSQPEPVAWDERLFRKGIAKPQRGAARSISRSAVFSTLP